MEYNENNVNPMMKPLNFPNVEKEIEWLKVAIKLACNYPDQSMQILGAGYIRELRELSSI